MSVYLSFSSSLCRCAYYISLFGRSHKGCAYVCVCLCVHARDFSNCIFPSSTTLLLYMYSTCCESAHPWFYWLYQHDIYTLHVHLLSYCIVVSYICRSGQIFVQGIHKTLAKEPGVKVGVKSRRKDWMVQRGVLWAFSPGELAIYWSCSSHCNVGWSNHLC